MRRLFCSLAVVLPAPVVAQAGGDPAGTIVVTGRGLATPIGSEAYDSVVIDRDRLTRDAANRIETILTDVAGFQQFRRSDSRSANPSAQGATLRGLGGNAASRALVLLDGVPQADPFFGYVPFTAIVPERLSSVRVTRGGGVGAFGAGAVAGTIDLASATRAELPSWSGSAFYGSRNAQEASASVSPDVGRALLTLSGRWERGNGFQTTPETQRVAATSRARYQDWSVGLRAVVPVGRDLEVQARGLVFRDRRTLRFRGADSRSDGEDASVRIVGRGRWAFDALAYVQARDFANVVVSATGFRTVLDQRGTPSTGIGAKVELRPPVGGAHVLRVGADVRRGEGELYEDAFNGGTGAPTLRRNAGGRTSTAGVFVEDDWTTGRLILTGGARLDRWTITQGFRTLRDPGGAITSDLRFPDRAGWQASGRAGLRATPTDAVAVRAAGYTGFRVPTLNELYRPFAVFPITTLANEALRLEQLRGGEAGITLTPARGVKLGLTGYYNRLGRAVANVTITPVLRQRQNVDAIVAKGIELNAEARVGAFDLSASYAYTDARVDGSGTAAALDGKRPAQTPGHAASATIAYRPEGGAQASATMRYLGPQFEDDLETDRLPGAVVVDAVARLPIGRHLAIVGRAENIFDKAVVTRNSGGSIDLGTPRTLWIGVQVND